VELLRGLFVREAFQITEDDRNAQRFGKAIDLRVKDELRLEINRRTRRLCRLPGGEVRFALPSSLSVRARLESDAKYHSMQPSGERIAGSHRVRLAGKDRERGLERIFDIMLVS
jgi:hypothetical protein